MARRDSEFTEWLTRDLPSLDVVTEWIGRYCGPTDVFSEKQLEEWATDHGWEEASESEN